ncbi:MAG: hypothetical protein GY846_14775 [Deltaproteobacteria bacterium]|nr:hypothetical protein [Deltaproteobacteria bacterium]
MLQMKDNYGVKKCFLIFLATLFCASAVCAAEKPLLILEGPDVVQVGTSTTYSVSTQGGTDSSYTWEWGYRTNEAATIDENGVLSANNPGVVGIRVYGNDTGARAELHVNVVSDKNGSVVITGPDKVVIGTTETFSASTTGSTTEGSYAWFISYSSGTSQIATLNVDTGEFAGISEGTVIIGVVDRTTGLSGSKTVDIVTTAKQTAKVSITAGLGEGFTLQATLSIRGDIPEDASLYIAIKYDGAFHFLPSGTTTMTSFRTNPQETDLETVYSVPISGIPFKEYTFYTALLNSRHELVSNLSSSVVSAGSK